MDREKGGRAKSCRDRERLRVGGEGDGVWRQEKSSVGCLLCGLSAPDPHPQLSESGARKPRCSEVTGARKPRCSER